MSKRRVPQQPTDADVLLLYTKGLLARLVQRAGGEIVFTPSDGEGVELLGDRLCMELREGALVVSLTETPRDAGTRTLDNMWALPAREPAPDENGSSGQ